MVPCLKHSALKVQTQTVYSSTERGTEVVCLMFCGLYCLVLTKSLEVGMKHLQEAQIAYASCRSQESTSHLHFLWTVLSTESFVPSIESLPFYRMMGF